MKEACINAQKTIDIEQYIIEDDDIGKKLFELLITKQKEGVHVRILCDMVGSYSFFSSDIPKTLREIGINVRFFNIIKPWRIQSFFSWFFRDHRKIMVVDNNLGFIGGVGFREDMREWRDTHVRVTGPVVKEMRFAFEEMWETAGKENFFRRMDRTRKFIPGFNFLTNSPFVQKRFIYKNIISTLKNAQKYIYITTPYFVPDRRLRRAFINAAKRGVYVKILIPKTSDFSVIDRASKTCFEQLLSNGVKIFLYHGEMLHAKTAVSDDSWSSIGSFNLDSLSFFYNYEANIISTKPKFALELKKLFEQDLKLAEEVSINNWRKRPRIEKFYELLIYPLRRFL
jgi:cardiolipin synthase